MSGGNRDELGRWGEAQAAEYMKQHGYCVLDARWRCKFGEIDLIAENGQYICFTEVKLRKNDRFAPARAFVTVSKQRKLRTTAELYLMTHPTERQPRFDVAEVYAPEGMNTEVPVIVYLENAF